MEIVDEIRTIVEDKLGSEQFLVEMKLLGKQGRKKILVIVDSDDGISIDACASLSRDLGSEIEKRGFMEGAYTLEVSSPGLEHPLKLERQYVKNIGRNVKIVLQDKGVEKGELVEVGKEIIKIRSSNKGKKKHREKGSILEIPFNKIKRTNVQVSFKPEKK